MPVTEVVFPLTPRRRLIGLSFGGMRSARRGPGSDVAGSRQYRPGDNIDTIDWAASARLSSARATDEFIVRERFAEEAPRVVIVCDRRPEMQLFPSWLPWLSKPEAVRICALMIADSTIAARGYSGYLDFADGDEVYWRPPRSQHDDWRTEAPRPFGAPQDTISRSFVHLFELRPSLLPGTFVFVVSDFVVEPEQELWLRAVERRWDVVPVVLQDPTWERTFPDVSGTMVPVVEPQTGKTTFLRLSKREALERRRANEERWRRLQRTFALLDLDPVSISTNNPAEILEAFTLWAEQRMYWRVRW
ncbi:MAG: DUF58 domain-containing protein [Actinobacteria bacterium]|nr:MAG: DUF58 domain-containing protein [Actinomycetota bacterium]TML20404.1 MAG: DUF58 domain-containing protein [Actinomycetota bacterium]